MTTPVERKPVGKGEAPPPKTRLQMLRDERKQPTFEPRLPEVAGGDQLLEWFWDVGPANAGSALTHTEIRNWQDNTGFELQSWQARLLRRMSQEYLAETQRAAADKCDPPCPLPDFARAPSAVAMSLRESMRALANT